MPGINISWKGLLGRLMKKMIKRCQPSKIGLNTNLTTRPKEGLALGLTVRI